MLNLQKFPRTRSRCSQQNLYLDQYGCISEYTPCCCNALKQLARVAVVSNPVSIYVLWSKRPSTGIPGVIGRASGGILSRLNFEPSTERGLLFKTMGRFDRPSRPEPLFVQFLFILLP